jgi:hypothetical protein
MKTKFLAAVALVATSFTPIITAPALASHVAEDLSKCTETAALAAGAEALPNSSWSYRTSIASHGEETPTITYSAVRYEGNSGNGVADRTTTVSRTATTQNCIGLNPGGNAVAEKSYIVTLVAASAGTPTVEYDVAVCENKSTTSLVSGPSVSCRGHGNW